MFFPARSISALHPITDDRVEVRCPGLIPGPERRTACSRRPGMVFSAPFALPSTEGTMQSQLNAILMLVVTIGVLAGACGGLMKRAEPDGPPVPFEDEGACPFEACVYRVWIAREPVVVRT